MREISCVQLSLVVITSCPEHENGTNKSSNVAHALVRAASRLFSTPLITRSFLLAKQRLRIRIRIKRHVEEPDHHLFPALIAVADFLSSVRIVLVIHGVVEMRRALDDRSLRQSYRLSQVVAKLPTEAVVRNLQQSLRLAVRQHDAI